MIVCQHCKAENADGARFCGVCGQATQSTHPVTDPRLGGAAEPPSMIGRELAGRFRILAKLGEGGMGTVYRAEQISLKRTVALKLLRPEVAASPLLVRRFNAEAEAVAKLNHPNTVGIYDFGQDADGSLFISMEFIEGKSLRDVVHTEAPLPLRRALHIATQVCASLIDAHAHAIVHRDLKPDNVMLQERGRQRDVVRVLDFGIAKLRDDSRQSQMAMTQAGDMLGTPQYMAPEQIRGEHVDGRVDIYALGCMLYEMVTARLPYDAPNVMALLSKHLLEAPVPPSQRRPDLNLPRAIDDLLLAAMAKDPGARPQTMEQYAEHLSAVLATLPLDAAPSWAPSAPPPTGHLAASPTPGFTPHGPPPASPAVTPAALAAPVGPLPYSSTPAPAPPAYMPAPAPPPAYVPAPPPLPPHVPPPAAPKSRTLMWVVISVLFIASGGIAAHFLSPDASAPRDDGGADPGRESDDASGDDAGSGSAQVPDPWASAARTPPSTVARGASAEPVDEVPTGADGEADGDMQELAALAERDPMAAMSKLLEGSEAIQVTPLLGFQVVDGTTKSQIRYSPMLSMSLLPAQMFMSAGNLFTLEVLGAERRAGRIAMTNAGTSTEIMMIELKGAGYSATLVVTSMEPHPSDAELVDLVNRGFTVPAP